MFAYIFVCYEKGLRNAINFDFGRVNIYMGTLKLLHKYLLCLKILVHTVHIACLAISDLFSTVARDLFLFSLKYFCPQLIILVKSLQLFRNEL